MARTNAGAEMKCNQCGKSVEQACKRDDCGINEKTSAAELRREDRAQRAAVNVLMADSQCQRNFAKVAEWSERQGWQRKVDREMYAKLAASTNQGKLVIQAIARSL